MQIESLFFASFLMIKALAPAVLAGDFKLYPGASADQTAARQASSQASGLQSEVYTSGDSFEKIYAFYKAKYKEALVPFQTQKLPDGKALKWAFFILDGEKDLARSHFWLKIQRPYIGTVGDGAFDIKNIRNVTVIQTIRRR